jgi:acyl carrier protein
MSLFDRFKKEAISPERKQELLSKIIPIFEKTLDIEKDKLKSEARIIEDLGADSLETVELVMALEEELNIEIPDEDAEKMKTIDDVIIYLDKKLEKGQNQ